MLLNKKMGKFRQNASPEERKMIACQLIRQVKVSKGYNVNIEFDMDYQQFCEGL